MSELKYPPPLPTNRGSTKALPPLSGMAIASLVLSLAGLLTAGLASILGIVLGHVSLQQIKKSQGKLRGSGIALAGAITGYAIIAMQALLIYAVTKSVGEYRSRRDEPFDLTSIAAPKFDGILDEAEEIRLGNIRVLQTETEGAGPGQNMQFRIYLPEGSEQARPASLTCILIAPAGTNLLTGVSLDPLDEFSYHDEALPYAQAGFVTVLYSLDGQEEEFASETETGNAEIRLLAKQYNAFRQSLAGLVNCRNALELAQKQLPSVNPTRIYTAGHSSAGTLSLLGAAYEPRLAGSIAYAPCTDVEAFHKELIETSLVEIWMTDLKNFLRKSSPINVIDQYACPLFLFQSEEDSVVSYTEFQAFVDLLETRPDAPPITKLVVPEGDHYYPMIQQGIPAGIAWIESQNRD